MEKNLWIRVMGIANGAYRIFEILIGLLSAAGCLLSLATAIAVIHAIWVHDEADKTAELIALLVSVPACVWCGQITWHLWSGRGRAGTNGLLSPTMLILFGIGVLVGVVALAATSRRPTGLGAFAAVAFAAFGMAAAQRRAERKAKRR